VLAPRIGYLPLLIPLIKPYFKDSLPPGEDSIWFDYKGFPLKWYIPTGVLFDLLCAEPERPWNLTIHFRGYPCNILIPCEGEDSVKWNFVNSLKEVSENFFKVYDFLIILSESLCSNYFRIDYKYCSIGFHIVEQ
jgi:autophagy-related protein 5